MEASIGGEMLPEVALVGGGVAIAMPGALQVDEVLRRLEQAIYEFKEAA